ncbi:LuxR C-terminal-related transcriptional regulator [Streptomyces sp. NPDC047023]|uniref:helix-turn-helix transcriptional regulator n=1 Tax=Streptomyces sp. NPDC047023 TaxID=3155139 RepID=UPI003411D4AE
MRQLSPPDIAAVDTLISNQIRHQLLHGRDACAGPRLRRLVTTAQRGATEHGQLAVGLWRRGPTERLVGAFAVRYAAPRSVLLVENTFTDPADTHAEQLAAMWTSDFAARQPGPPRLRCVTRAAAIGPRHVQAGGWTEVSHPATLRGGWTLLEQRAAIMPLLAQWVRTEYVPGLPPPTEGHPRPTLHPRMLTVSRLYANGLTTAQLAEKLSLSVQTVKTHTARARSLTATRSTTALIQYLYLREELGRHAASGVIAEVSPRQRAVLGLAAFGDAQAGIARTIGVSLEIVKADLRALRSAFGAHTNPHLVARAWDEGFLR